MPESTLDIIYRSRSEGSQSAVTDATGALTNIQTGMTNAEKAMSGTRSTVSGLDKDMHAFGLNLGSAADAMKGFGISIPLTPMDALAQGVTAVKEKIDSSIESYSNYVSEMSKFARVAGTTTEEASKLAQVSEDLNVSTETLTAAMRRMVQTGTTPSMEGLGQLSDKYLSLQTPLEKSKFLLDNFGRSGLEMGKMMEQGSEGLKKMSDSVEKWMIVSGKSTEQVEKYKQAVRDSEDAQAAYDFQIAMKTLPLKTTYLDLMTRSTQHQMEDQASWMRYVPVLQLVYGAYNAIASIIEHILNIQGQVQSSIPGHAYGGPMSAGEGSVVGENGPEWFRAPTSGMVIPNSSLSMSGAGGSQSVTIVINSPVNLMKQQEIENILIPILQRANRRLT